MTLRRRVGWSRPDLVRVGTQPPPTRRMRGGLAHHQCLGSDQEVQAAMCGRPARAAWATALQACRASPVVLDNGRSPVGWQPAPRAVASRVRSWHAGHRLRLWQQETASALRSGIPTATSKALHQSLAVSFPLVRRRPRTRRAAPSASRSAPGVPSHRRPWSGRRPAPTRGQSLSRRRERPPAAAAGSSAVEQ